ncbi:MAG TPA: indole-3-glycerol phosphate synthase TrpC [Phnomibacter sp.]|nr:indole-3-glycerol phosphate synthase TrpC [Phnomibacter sp.]
MNILEQIMATKKEEVASRMKTTPVAMLEQQPGFARTTVSLCASIKQPGTTGIIAEYKRQSPSKGIINPHAKVQEVVSAYTRFGASGISVLTDELYFGGSTAHLQAARAITPLPLIRKDFIWHEYQITEARAMGADVILLIAACLSPQQVQQLATFAHSLQLEVLLELHDPAELEHVCPEADLIGINNRNLKTFEVNLQQSIQLANQLPAGRPRIAESGIHSAETLLYLKQQGFDGFLMGEYFMKQANPALAFEQFVQAISQTTTNTEH